MCLGSSGDHRGSGEAVTIMLTPYCAELTIERLREYFVRSMLPAAIT
jgi:hypothetical protein